MSLVDYSYSDEDDDDESQQVKVSSPKRPHFEGPAQKPHNMLSAHAAPHSKDKKVTIPDNPSKLNLPDASALLNAPSASSNPPNTSDHESRVAAAMAESAARKRESNVSSADNHRSSKVPKGRMHQLAHTKNVSDTSGGCFVPPQLAGRSNVVTEDISKLFVKKNANPSTQ